MKNILTKAQLFHQMTRIVKIIALKKNVSAIELIDSNNFNLKEEKSSSNNQVSDEQLKEALKHYRSSQKGYRSLKAMNSRFR